MTQPDKLFGCPFCGWHTPAMKDAGMQRHQVRCPACGGSGGICKEITDAEKQWNMRHDNQSEDLYEHTLSHSIPKPLIVSDDNKIPDDHRATTHKIDENGNIVQKLVCIYKDCPMHP